MSKSRSGTIRQAIGPVRSRLVGYVNSGEQLLNLVVTADNLGACQKLVDDVQELSAKMKVSIGTLSDRDNQWQNLILALDDDKVAEEEALYEKTALDSKEGYLTIIEHAKELICRLDRRKTEVERLLAAPIAAIAVPATATEHPQQTSRRMATLPKLTLPTFDGDCLDWQNFWSIFKVNVHDQQLVPTEKFAYLRGQLSGVALQSIDGLIINDANYQTALTILRERFERSPAQLVGALYSQLKRLPMSATTMSSLVATYDGCERIFRQLENSGEDVDANRSLVLDVLSKYPSTVVTDLMKQQNVGTESSLAEVRGAIKTFIKQSGNIAEMLEDLDPFDNSSRSLGRPKQDMVRYKPPKYESDAARGPVHTSAFAAASQLAGNRTTPNPTPEGPCYFCGGRHFNAQCDKYPTIEQRVERLRGLKRCRRCLRPDHIELACNVSWNKIRCFLCKAVGKHATPLCPVHCASGSTTPKLETKDNKADDSALLNVGEQAMLMTANTTAVNPETGATINVRLIFDSGSHRSYITESCANGLELPVLHDEALHVSIFGTKRSLSVASHQVCFDIRQRDGTVRRVHAHTTPMITNCEITARHLPACDVMVVEQMRYEMADDFESMNGSIDILVGTDYFWDFLTGTRVSTPSGLYMIQSTLGWLVGGRYNDENLMSGAAQPTLLCLTETFSRLPNESGLMATKSMAVPPCPDIDEYWSLESIGITDDAVIKDDDIALSQFNESVYHADGRYHVRWPWKSTCNDLPVNYELALGRFNSLAKRLSTTTDPTVRTKYQEVINDQLKRGIIERVPEVERGPRISSNLVHYLPHHPVVKPNSATTKVRIVYDASAKTKKDNPSLNECMYRGPVMLPDLCAILVRFRLHPIALVGDIEKAFLQMCLQPTDRDVTRFFWFADSSDPDSENNVAEFRFLRVPFGVIASPFLLNAVTQYHLKRVDTWVARLIAPNMYVDNVICGVDDDNTAKLVYSEAKFIFKTAGMNLQQFGSNSTAFMDHLPESDRIAPGVNKVLGMEWDRTADSISLKNNLGNNTEMPVLLTKRGILKMIASVYDPLGLYQPVLFPAKLFLQRLWQLNTSWDDDIAAEFGAEWRQIYTDILPVFGITIPRHPKGMINDESTTIAVFSDASQAGYATAVYLRSWDGQSCSWATHLVYSKSRLSPKTKTATSPVSLPRLELLGAVIGCRAVQFIRDALSSVPSPRVHMFSDSMCVLHWLRSSKPLSAFVSNRIRELNLMPNTEFLYVGTADNPADYGTRGKTAEQLRACSLWWHGPKWLSEPRDRWPTDDIVSLPPVVMDEVSEEIRKTPQVFHTILAGDGLDAPGEVRYPLGMNPAASSSFRKLQRICAWCLKYLKLRVWDKLSDGARERAPGAGRVFNGMSSERYITSSELNVAKNIWVRYVQEMNYDDLHDAIEKKSPHPLIKQLGANTDDAGIIRCYGRFEHANLTTEAICPKLLARNDHVTNLVIRDIHEKLCHAGVGHTLSQLRREYWVPHGRNVVRKVVTRCITCRKHKGGSFALPPMPPWPRERVSRSSPFRFTGLDYFGPVNVRIRDTVQKMWICLFTCLAVRAVHLEWVGDCSAKEFLECFIRFVSRRGTPEQVISDNAGQFRVTKSVLDKIWLEVIHDDSVQSYAADQGIVWRFTTELAPWHGGFYERLVGVVKGAFKAAVGRRLLPLGEFVTLIAEIEAVVNSRPITYVYEDIASGPTLRPIDFLTDLAAGFPASEPTLRLEGLGDAGKQLVRYWKVKQNRLNSLWRFWYDEYLLSLRERGQTKHRGRKGDVPMSPKLNEVVIVKDTDAPRGAWKMARVIRLVPSRDGAVRSVELTLPNKAVIRRAVSHLFPLEIDAEPQSTPLPSEAPAEGDVERFDGFTAEEVGEAEERVRRCQTAQVHARVNIANNLNAAALTVEL